MERHSAAMRNHAAVETRKAVTFTKIYATNTIKSAFEASCNASVVSFHGEL